MPELLNFGCGNRFSKEWTNIDFHSSDPNVQRVNLLLGFPFQDAKFDAVYSSHTLEHFTLDQGRFILSECFRVLRPGGVLRIVVPDLQGSCTEYLRVLGLPDGDEKKKLYEWIIVEMLDQMVRDKPSGKMGPLINRVHAGDDSGFREYIVSRTQNTEGQSVESGNSQGIRAKLNFQKLKTRVNYWHIRAVSLLLPRSLRDLVIVQTLVGERHRWMYDEYGLKLLLNDVGFQGISRLSYNESSIDQFNSYFLDCTLDGKPYKYNSIFMECRK